MITRIVIRFVYREEIKGFQYQDNDGIFRTRKKDLPCFDTSDNEKGLEGWKCYPSVDDDMHIVCDSIELGTEVNNEYWFEGDIILIKNKQCTDQKRMLVFECYSWWLRYHEGIGSYVRTSLEELLHNESNVLSKVGNIHEREL